MGWLTTKFVSTPRDNITKNRGFTPKITKRKKKGEKLKIKAVKG